MAAHAATRKVLLARNSIQNCRNELVELHCGEARCFEALFSAITEFASKFIAHIWPLTPIIARTLDAC